ncbi:disease resistance protein RGA5-like [Triticum dicoccoides]|uniref:disease resistance protein RGA5-like n=1 Tax=Triticum dicoccoides TaxID=85692 RepID=UPI00188EF82D|nr:disease resistance protein RGA5-like [Triticum dicoccoides]
MEEEGLVSAATGALQPALGKLAALLGDDEDKRLRGEAELLTRELAAMDAFLLAKSSSSSSDLIPSAQDKACMHEIRELSYDIDDDLHDFMEASVCDKSAELAGLLDKMKAILGRTKARHEMIAKAVDDLKERVAQVAERHSHKRSKVDRRAPAILDDAPKLVGVDGPKEELIQLLSGSVESTQQQPTPNLVAIVGSGGTGKTTLANQVYQELEGQLDCHAFCSVRRNPDKARVLRSIYNQLYSSYNNLDRLSSPRPGVRDLPGLITMISDYLENRRCIIVLDDIWDVEILKVIECAFPTASSGSKIIITTRIHAVAQSCCSTFSGHVYNIRPLSMVHSRQLFHTRLFNSEEKCPSYLEEISGQILDKCAGLPLAITAISGVLADKASEKEIWDQVKDLIGRALRNSSVEDMVNIISLSYLDLPPHLKTCLLYLSIFPEGHIIEKENLIRRWIGEGFIQKKSGYTVYESGEMCFNDLINRNLIQPAKLDETFGDEVKNCCVHDTVHNFIVSKAVEENFVTIVGVPGVINPDPKAKIRRVSLQNDGEVPPSLDVSSARSLHVFGRNVKIPSLSEFRLLRVLDFENCSQLEDDHLVGIGNLLQLKYLRFKHAKAVMKIPEQVAMLHHLEIDVNGYGKLMEIPMTIQERLACYVTLCVDGYETVPDEIAAMQGLRVLEGLNIYTQSTEFLKRLGQLKKLRKLGIIWNMYDMGNCDVNYDKEEEEIEEEFLSSICELGKAGLESLHIFVREAADAYFKRSWFPDPQCGLRELIIVGDFLSEVPTWVASLVNLEKLCITMRVINERDMEILRGLPSLRHLRIYADADEDDVSESRAAMEKAMEEHPNRPTLVWYED